MKQWAVWGGVGIVLGGMAFDANAQLKEITDAAGKLAGRVMGKDVSATDTVSGTAPLPNVGSEKSARVMLLDKQTNRRQTLVLVAGEAQTVGTVQVSLTKCTSDYAAVLGQDVAWLDVTESAEGNGRSTPWFSGWMFNTYPEVSTLDHPRYELQLMGCGVKARQVLKATGSAPVVESGPVTDTESSGADGDPYYVPGVGAATVTPTEPAAAAATTETPAADTEAPAEPAAPVAQPVEATPAGSDQQDLHQMMDGTY